MNNNFLEVGVSKNRFLYQGKEWQTELGLNLYDFHARQFDPALGRFTSIDAASQFASPYLGMGNMPTMGVDPDGNFAWFVPAIFAGVNLLGDAIRGNLDNFGDVLGSLGKGALQGTIAAITGGSSFAAQGGAWTALGQSLSSQLPGVDVTVGDFNLSVSPAIILGSHRAAAGISGTVGYESGNFSAAIGFGAFQGKDLGSNKNTSFGNTSWKAGFDDGKFGLTVGKAKYYSGETTQKTSLFGFRTGDIHVTHENDIFGENGSLLDGRNIRDRYRTAALEISYRDEIGIGFNLFTGDPWEGGRYNPKFEDGVKYISQSADKYRHGLLYFRYGNHRAGIDSEGVRAFIQNNFHNLTGDPHFRKLVIPTKVYHEYFNGQRNGFLY